MVFRHGSSTRILLEVLCNINSVEYQLKFCVNSVHLSKCQGLTILYHNGTVPKAGHN